MLQFVVWRKGKGKSKDTWSQKTRFGTNVKNLFYPRGWWQSNDALERPPPKIKPFGAYALPIVYSFRKTMCRMALVEFVSGRS